MALLITWLCSTVSSQVPPPDVSVSIDRTAATVGDPILVTLTLRFDSTLKLIEPARSQQLGDFDVLGDTLLSNSLGRDGQREYRRRLRLAAFRTGEFWVPPLTGELVDQHGTSTRWQTDSLQVTVASVLAGSDDTADIRGLKGPYVAAESRWWLWIAGAVAFVSAALWWWFRRRRRAATVIAPPPPPWESAMQALESLRREVNPQLDGGRLWYFQLSEILRRYWDGRYGWASIDQTSTEIMDRLEQAPFNGTHRSRAREFLDVADQIRYARLPARSGRPEVDWEWVRDFVSTTIPRVPDADVGEGSEKSEPGVTAPSTQT